MKKLNFDQKIESILLEKTQIQVKRVSNKEIEVDGERKDIFTWLYEISENGREFLIIDASRRNDKKDKATGQIVGRAGDTIHLQCKMGRCNKDDQKIGSPLGNPSQRYVKYGLMTVCAKRPDVEGGYRSTHIGSETITQVSASYRTYVFT